MAVCRACRFCVRYCFYTTFIPNGVVIIPRGPAHAGAAPEPGDPVPTPDWMTAEDWEAWCDATFDLGEESPPGLGWDDEEEGARIQEVKRAQLTEPPA